jgi:hypothetical protein
LLQKYLYIAYPTVDYANADSVNIHDHGQAYPCVADLSRL